MRSTTAFRIHNSPAWHGKPVVQKWDPAWCVWADVGDALDTRAEAEARLRALEAAEQRRKR